MATHIFSISLRFLLSISLLFLCLLCSLKKGYAAYERRETTESHHLQHSHIIQVTSLLPAAVCNPSTKGTRNKRASLKVVHKHGPCSQFSQDKANAPNLTHILLQDQARVNSIQARLYNSGGGNLHDSKATLPVNSGSSVSTGNYVVTVGLGTPKKELTFVFDTGSDLTWTQCKPCAKYCHTQKEPIFDPSKSTSYKNITCNSTVCSQLTSATGISPGCTTSSTCIYGIQYGDRSYSVGFFGKEKLTLTSTDVFDNFLFGCGQNNRGLFGEAAGLFGLGRDKLSFVSQSAQKYGRFFSYCLPSSSSTGHLSFGKRSGVSSRVKFTPLSKSSQNPSFYFIDMIGISIGGRKLSIPRSVFSTTRTLIDSGTIITRLPPKAYATMRSAFRQLMSNYTMTQPLSILDTCYDLSQYDSVSIPKISFYFNGGVEVQEGLSGIVYVADASQVCLAFAGNSDDTDVAIFGNLQQATFDVVYDVAGGKLGFGRGGCD